MRMMMKAVIEDTQAGNEAIRNGSIQETIKAMLEQLQPEAAYFVEDNGHRSVIAVFDMVDSSQLPVISEPMFQKVNARVSIYPCMNLEDLQKGLARLTL
jgi:hypothetical protein